MSNFQNIFSTIQQNPLLLILFSFYTLTLKGFALWKAAKNSHRYWFVGLLVINLLGLPEILYLIYFSKKHISVPFKIVSKEKSKK